MSATTASDTRGRPPAPVELSVDGGLFGPDSITWRVHADPVFPLGGMRALLLQALHPRAMAAVAQHGGFEADYWGRLGRTSEYVATLTYADRTRAERMAARVRGVHRRLSATDLFTGETFRVDEPELLLWVHCCEVESFLTVAQRAGVPLSPADADRYLAEQVTAAALIGIDPATVPADRVAMADYFTDIRPRLRTTSEARRGARALVAPPMPSWVSFLTPARPAWAGLASLAFTTLPGWARRMYSFPALPTTDLAATGALRAVRAGLTTLPDKWREPPAVTQARALMDSAERARAS
ncbi:DUF2236 domain-containing protein [Nakamurella flavida]|uniref:DUF2236 domain-containing protein n=1 Tax=Nakamurella flavida TaxID=363630 RepID=A0A938YMX2_9ACTN|nr:oxygenase MpaB family protein [Nakamurella flavida]MBM9476307.1 DUF2236 domain-containing protein [Nakamurella flavida]MDP9779593.1 uncharacterized protein (DUF2236 family) [Nakamurella flavida]